MAMTPDELIDTSMMLIVHSGLDVVRRCVPRIAGSKSR